jgi:hypothetical protein
MSKNKRGECLNMAEPDNDYYIRGHNLTEDEIWQAIVDDEEEHMGERNLSLLKEIYSIRLKREEWKRWGLCTCGDEHYRDLYDAKPYTRGAFPTTYVILNLREKL